MPPTTRQRTNDSTDATDTSGRNGAVDKTAAKAEAATDTTVTETAAAGSGAAAALRQIIAAPTTVARAVADDVVTTARRPDAVLYVGGLVGLAALGVLEWPVVAVAGVGVAVANGVRRART